MSEVYDEDIEEDVGSSSLKEDSNVYNEDFSQSSSKSHDKNKDKKQDKKEKQFKKEKKSKSSSSSSSSSNSSKKDLNEYEQDFDEEEKPKQIEQKKEIELKPTQTQMKQQANNQGKEQQFDENKDSVLEFEDSSKDLKNTINDDQLKKQQLSFIGNLNKFLTHQQNPSQTQDQQSSKGFSDSSKGKNDNPKPPIPNKQNYVKDYLQEKPKKKPDIESVPNDEEIEDIIKKNQQDFLQMINSRSQKTSPRKEKEQYDREEEVYEDSQNEYYDADEEELHVIYETDREDSQVGRTSHNESYDNHYYSEGGYGSSIYQQYSVKDIQEEDEDDLDEDEYYEQTEEKKKKIPNKVRIQTQKEYERIISEKKLELKQLQEIQKLKEQLNVNIDVHDEQMQQIARKAKLKEKEIQDIKIMQERMRYGCRKCAEANSQKDREAYREENDYLRKVNNEYETQIKLLKVQLRKSSDRALDNSFSSIGSTSTSVQRKMEELENEKEKLKQENLSLRNKLKESQNASSSRMNRQQKLHLEIQKVLGSDIRKLQEKENKKPLDPNLERQFKAATERVAELRLDLEKMIKKYEDQKQKLKDKDEQIISLKKKVQGRHFQKLLDKIHEQQGIVDNFEKDKEQIRDDMQLDKQLELLFPNQMVLICNFFNICVAVEEIKRGRYQRITNIICHQAKPIFKYFSNLFHTIKDSIKFKITKKPIDHPHQQEIIRATIKAWNESPEIVAKQMRSQEQELKELRNKFILMEDEIEDLQNRNELLEKDVEILRSRNSVLETRLTVDKNKLINNVIIQLKYHNVEDEEEDYLLDLKKLINTIKEGPPLLISQAERDAFKKQQFLEAEKERKKRDREERKKEMALRKQQKLEEKREKEEKEKEEQLLQQKQKGIRPSSALRYKTNQTPQQIKETRPSSALINVKKTPTLNSTQTKLSSTSVKQKEEASKDNSQQDPNNKSKDNKNFRVSNLTNKLRQSLTSNNNTITNNNNNNS